MSCYIYQLPSWVLDDLCRNMDTLSEWDWMQFASYVITDLTQLRRIKSLERVQGVSITRELLWWWGMRQATVQELLDLLHRLQLYRAAQIISNWKPAVPEVPPALPDSEPPHFGTPRRPVAAFAPDTEDGQGQGQGQPRRPAVSQDPGPLPPAASLPASAECPLSLRSPTSDSKPCSTSIPQQEVLWDQPVDGLFWEEVDVVQATDNFSPHRRLCHGTFADVYRGQRHGEALIFKKLREVPCSGPGAVARFFKAELQVCRRCCHPNILPLLGFCPGKHFYSFIYPFMANGSLQDRLQCQGGSDPLSWSQRTRVCTGLFQAVAYLHSLEIIHSNIRSSNVLLDGALTPKLAHPASQLCSVHKKSSYTLVKTRLFQASAAYLPEDSIRVGLPTKRVDIFSCGIVLAEILTGMPAMDDTRKPVFLKDLLLSDIPSSSSSSSSSSQCSRKLDAEKALAQELCLQHLDGKAGWLPQDCALALALAACLCVRRKKPSLTEACDAVAAVEGQLRGLEASAPWSALSQGTSTASNTPEETDDVEVSCVDAASTWPVSLAGAPPTEGRLQASGVAEADSSSEATSWKIEINAAKRKLMEDFLLYKEGQLDSGELFGS